jgi:hypothetical protein
MAGGTFDPLVGKVRPGTYINFRSVKQESVPLSERGIVLIPLLNADWGPHKEFITITQDAPDANFSKLGHSVYDINDNMLLIREALKRASKVIVYRPTDGAKATATAEPLTVTAKYSGERGNDIRFVISTNPVSGKDFVLYLGTEKLFEVNGITNVEDLPANDWVTFSGTGALAVTAGTNLAGGSNGVQVNGDITDFLDDSEIVKWNDLAFPITDETLQTALKTKIKYFRESVGKYVKAVAPDFPADYEGIINVTNAVKLADGTELTKAQMTAYVAALDAAAPNNKSNTYERYDGAVDVIGKKNHEQSVAAINNGEFFFSMNEDKVVVEYDINSLVTIVAPKGSDYKKNRVLRVFDTFAEALQNNFPPNKYDNSPDGWDIMEGVGKILLQEFADNHAIKNVDMDNDFLVDRVKSTGDKTFFKVGLEPVDSAEKLYFDIKTR